MPFTDSNINQYFDQVYVLNLTKRTDRKMAMLKKLNRLGIKAEFVEAINGYSDVNKKEHQLYLKQPIGGKSSHKLEREYKRKLIASPGAWGYLKTYFGILQDAKKRNFQRILCLDDDVVFCHDFESQFQEAIKQIPEDWKLLYLGASQYVWKIPQGLSYTDNKKKAIDENEPFYFPNNTDGSFAMGIDASVFDLLISDILKMDCPFDSGALRTVIDRHPKKCFVFNPNIIIADVSESDIREGQDQQKLAERLRWRLDDYDFNTYNQLVSVIMPAYNAEKTIEKAIRSILMQSYGHLEMIVVDDASTDKTAEVVAKLMNEDSRIKLIKLEENKGVGGARNAGLYESKGDFIAFQDADDVSLKDRLIKQLLPIYEKGVLFTFSNIYRSRCTMDELDITDQSSMMQMVEQRRKSDWKGNFGYDDMAHIGLVTTIYKREVFEKFGVFDEHRFAEDLEFIERVIFHSLGVEFYKGFNGHSFFTQKKVSPGLFQRIDDVLFVCSVMDESNLSIQHGDKQEENHLRAEKFRNKFKSLGLSAYPKLPHVQSSNKLKGQILYSTIRIDSFNFPLEFEKQNLITIQSEYKEDRTLFEKMKSIYTTIGRKINSVLGRFKSAAK